jgi:GT2 family glycosyltransferase/ADP-heptose:LPS heptosyltransferase
MQLLPVLHIGPHDIEQAKHLLRAAHHLDGCFQGTLVITHESTTDIEPVRALAHAAFLGVIELPYDPWTGPRSWPTPQNIAWQRSARLVQQLIHTDPKLAKFRRWFWWEADACPLRANWLTTLNAASKRTLFAGVPCSDSTTSFYMNGVGIWPTEIEDALANCSSLYDIANPFDRLAGRIVRTSFTDLSKLLIHAPKLRGGTTGTSFDTDRFKRLLADHPDAVFYHGCGDTTLAQAVCGKRLKPLGTTAATPAKRTTNTPAATLPTGTAPLFTISVLCLNNLDLTRACIESILAHSGPPSRYELIITDNGSTDGTAKWLKALKRRPKTSHIRIVTNPTNLGFQDPNAHALTLARGQFLVLFNNDMEACPGWLDALHASFSTDPLLAITGVSGTCGNLDAKFQGQPTNDTNPEYIDGGCLMIPTAIARRHGLWSDYIKFAYFEDTDLSLRLRELGYNIQTVPIPISHHHRSATSRNLNLIDVIQHNKAAMWDRWGFYIRRRSFARNVLINRRGARGDVLLLTPALAALHAKWPQTTFSVSTDHPEMLTGLPYVDARTKHPKLDWDATFDLDLCYETQPALHICDAFAAALNTTLTSHTPLVHISEQDDAWASRALRHQPTVLVHPGPTTWPGKNWPFDRWQELTAHLQHLGYRVVTVGASDTPALGDDSFAGQTTPQQLAALARHAKLFIGLDSMPQHVVASQSTPSVILFGATNPAAIISNPNAIAVQATTADAPCVGEHGRRAPGQPTTEMPCDGACMRAITLELVFKALDQHMFFKNA